MSTPCPYHWNQRQFEVVEILDRWHQADQIVDWLVVHYYKVIPNTGMQCILKHDVEVDQWYLVKDL